YVHHQSAEWAGYGQAVLDPPADRRTYPSVAGHGPAIALSAVARRPQGPAVAGQSQRDHIAITPRSKAGEVAYHGAQDGVEALDTGQVDAFGWRMRTADRRAERDHVHLRILGADQTALQPGMHDLDLGFVAGD